MFNFAMITFSSPWYFLLLIAPIVLVVIYYLFRHTKIKVVSNLFLWEQQICTNKSGKILKKLPLPLTFFIELLIILLLIFAAVDTLIERYGLQKEAIVILDDSFSMQAFSKKNNEYINNLAVKRLEEILQNNHQNQKIKIYLAGQNSKNLGAFLSVNEALFSVKDNYKCEQINANLLETLSLAKKYNNTNAPIYVFSDSAPNIELSSEVQWHALGEQLPNVAIINCARNLVNNVDKCMFVISNISPHTVNSVLTISQHKFDDEKIKSIKEKKFKNIKKLISLKPNSYKKISVKLPPNTKAIKAQIADDSLQFDNSVILLPNELKPLGVKVAINDVKCNNLVRKALGVVDKVKIVRNNPELVITDSYKNMEKNATNLLIVTEQTFGGLIFSVKNEVTNNDYTNQLLKNSATFSAPFTINRANSIALGIDLQETIWGANTLNKNFILTQPSSQNKNITKAIIKIIDDMFSSEVIVMAKQNILLSIKNDESDGTKNIFMFFDLNKSTLQNTPAFPILFWNIVDFVINRRTGLSSKNYRCGEELFFNVNVQKNNQIKNIKIMKNGSKKAVLYRQNFAHNYLINTNEKGYFKLYFGEDESQFYVNALSYNESNLLENKVTKIYKKDRDKTLMSKYYFSTNKIFIFMALLLLTIHYYMIRKREGGLEK
ncbi:BatA domain-containing protein [Lentisphaerota bacterium WC36G]|nr:BatA domain-containing protein [Lentisphaerae bacterium WC36]